jgi:hypothetical protein
MKPRLRKVMGYWQCGLPGEHSVWWSVAPTPREAFDLWRRVRG